MRFENPLLKKEFKLFIVDVIGVLIMNKNNKKVSVYHRCSMSEGYPFLYMSSNFLNLVGWSREEIESEFDNKLWNMIHPADRNFNVASNMCVNFACYVRMAIILCVKALI